MSNTLSPVASSNKTVHYALRLATNIDDLHAAQRLRYQVFNLELHEGLENSESHGLDSDKFDIHCDHLLVEHLPSHAIVGTYRLQTGMLALAQEGYYSAEEFYFAPYETIRHELIELGRACIDRHHRNISVLHLLWRGIAKYATDRNCRYLIGCSSLPTLDESIGAAMYAELAAEHLAEPEFQTEPLPGFELSEVIEIPAVYPSTPRLLRAYLNIGAKICGPPAIDRTFKTIDFLTLVDLRKLRPAVRDHFLGTEGSNAIKE
jgi:putative hemolysin